ncbi:MAG: sigma-70 family RNA polymerase sigma factor [Bacteroidales bacterium]|nr:sigma-70 family RNA polymerase sigma factor [Bacteroidales bacterium]OJX89765.1 MAG: RNA polymerase subunit sigma-70 [Paludibacter sp. 47-17]
MSQELFRAAVLPMRDYLFSTARRILSEEDDAEDAVQEVLLKLWYIRDSLGTYDNVEAFVTTVTKNHCLDKLKVKKRTEGITDSVLVMQSDTTPYELTERSDTHAIIRRIIEQLPPLQREIIRMKDMEEYEVDEIADITGTKPDAVRMNLSRARKKVREEFLKWNSV